ncbi:MAG: hypothetical protein ABSF70_19070 [Terracidiphilus sp.]
MKTKIVLAAALMMLLACPPLVHAVATCQTETLANYIALGAEGCIFDAALYNNFGFSTASANGVNPSNILVTPDLLITATLFPGLNFSPLPLSTAGWSVGAGLSEQFVISYDVSPISAGVAAATGVLTLDLGTSHVSGIIGSVTVTEAIAATSTAAPLKVFDTCEEVCSIKQSDSVTVTPVSTLHTILTVSLTGGTGGVSLNSFAADDAFGPQPG